jgi:hypothetical protein
MKGSNTKDITSSVDNMKNNTVKGSADTNRLKLGELDLGFMPFPTHYTTATKETGLRDEDDCAACS